MKWSLSDTEKERIRACINSIEYPKNDVERSLGLAKLQGYLEGEKHVAYGLCKMYHATLVPLLYSIIHTKDQARLAFKILTEVAGECSRKHISFLLVTDRFKALMNRIGDEDRETAALASRVMCTLLKVEDGIKDLFWELHLHQILRKALTAALSDVRTKLSSQKHPAHTSCGTVRHVMSLLDLLTCSTASARHRQELYGSGYGLCGQLLTTTSLCIKQGAAETLTEHLIITVSVLVRENKLNQDDFRKEPKLSMLREILMHANHLPTGARIKHAVELLYLFLTYGNEGVANVIKEEVPCFVLHPDLSAFMVVLVEGLESLKRHHYDVDVVVRSLRVVEEHLVSSDCLRAQKCYYFRNSISAWSLLFLCLNNIDERIMYQACCLTAQLVKDNPWNQEVLMEMGGVETLSEILLDYNLDIQLVGLQVLGTLKGSSVKCVGYSCIVDYVLRIIGQFPTEFAKIVQHRSHSGPCMASPALNVTTSLQADQDLSSAANWEKQITIVQHALSLIGDIVTFCPDVKVRVMEAEKGDHGLLQILATACSYLNSFYFTAKEAREGAHGHLRVHLRAQTAPGRLTGPREARGSGLSVPMDQTAARSPLKKIGSFFVEVLLGVLETTCTALSSVVRHSHEAQGMFHGSGGIESVLNCLHTLVTFSETRGGHEHEAWIKVHRTSTGEGIQDISYVDNALSLLRPAVGEEEDGTSSATIGKSMYLCQNSWLVNPEVIASLLLILVNTSEANADVQRALCEPKVRLLLHYLASHPSHLVVNTTLLLISHLCFSNPVNQQFFATPYIVQRLQSLSAVSYIQLLQTTGTPSEGLVIPWNSEHLHLLTPADGSVDVASFYAFQSLAYGFVCLSHLLQSHPTVITVLLPARVHVNGNSVSWIRLLAQCPLLPCYPIQDASMTLISNMIHGCTPNQREEIVDQYITDALIQLIELDSSDDDSGCPPEPSSSASREAELKWLSNKAFQLLLNMGAPSTKRILAQVKALVAVLPDYPDLPPCPLSPPSSSHQEDPSGEASDRPSPENGLSLSVPLDYYKGADEVDVYNSLVNRLPILNGLTYSSDICRKTCLDEGCWDVMAALSCKQGVELDVKVCTMYIMSNMVSHSQILGCEAYVKLVEGRRLDSVAQLLLEHPNEVRGEESINMNADYVGSLFQLAAQLVLRIGSHPVAGLPSRRFLTASPEDSPLLRLAQREMIQPTSVTGLEALSFLLLLGEDEIVAATYLAQPCVQQLLSRSLDDAALPQTTALLVRKYLVNEPLHGTAVA